VVCGIAVRVDGEREEVPAVHERVARLRLVVVMCAYCITSVQGSTQELPW
jgi:hypothetical protein